MNTSQERLVWQDEDWHRSSPLTFWTTGAKFLIPSCNFFFKTRVKPPPPSEKGLIASRS